MNITYICPFLRVSQKSSNIRVSMILGDTISALETFVWILNHVSRSITWSLASLVMKLSQVPHLNVIFNVVSLSIAIGYNMRLAPVPCWICRATFKTIGRDKRYGFRDLERTRKGTRKKWRDGSRINVLRPHLLLDSEKSRFFNRRVPSGEYVPNQNNS